MEYRILGPLEVLDASGRKLPLGGAMQQSVLASLLLRAGQTVALDRLVDELWQEPPATAARTVQAYVSRLRRELPDGAIESRTGGYALALDGDEFDLDAFERRAEEGHAALVGGECERAAILLGEALALWRGPALAGLASDALRRQAERLEDLRLSVLEDRIEADLGSAWHGEIVPELKTLVAEHPFRERLRAQLMRAFYRSGRPGEALALYRETRRLLVGELGMEPGQELRELEQAILRQDAELEAPQAHRSVPREEPLAVAPRRAEATRRERKVLTCLFADLVGFTARAESLDPEDAEAILRPYHERLRSELERHGGTVEKFIGDAVMALFGAPIAHEDDPERAVRAALAIRDWASDEGGLEVSVGITTGEALVLLGARPEAGEGVASGDVVNTASRLQSAAPTNGILIDETTFRATRHAIDSGEVEPIEAKGKAEPVRVWEPLEARDRIGAGVAARQTPLVGREQERRLLTGALDRARNERSIQLVTLVGTPGIGKSRLVAELFQHVSENPELVTWREGRSLPYGDGITYSALNEMVKNQTGILETDTAEQRAEKLHAEVARLLGDDAEARSVEARLGLLIGLEAGTEQLEDRRAENFYAWRRFFEELADKRPAVLAFEDVHWADDALLDFVDHLVEWAVDVPLLCLCTARPELLERRPAWAGGKPNASTISVSPLSDEETARLISALVERKLSAEQQSALLARVGGNPLYAEQFARLLTGRDDGDELPLPETVQGIIAARLDGLEPEEKAVLQDAAVIGEVFWTGALAQMDGRDRAAVAQNLRALARKVYVRRRRRPSVAGESEYAFLHVLVRDVAYGQIPKAARSGRHRAVAEWMATLGGAEEHSEVLAHHYLQALEYAQADGTTDPALKQGARQALRSAGDRALSLNAPAAAARFYRHALDLWSREDPERVYVLFGLGVARYRAEGALTELNEARHELVSHGDREKAAEADAIASYESASVEESLARLEQALELVRDRPPSRSKAFVLAQLAHRALSVGDAAWERHAEEALAMVESLGLEDVRSFVLMTIGTGRADIEPLEQAVKVGDAIDTIDSVTARIDLAAHLQSQGDLQRGFEVQARARHDAERFGVRKWIRHLRAELVWEWYWRGLWDESSGEADTFLAEVEATELTEGKLAVTCARAHIRLARGDLAGAIGDAEQAVRAAREWGVWGAVATALAGYARVLSAAGRSGEADALLTEALRLDLSPLAWPDLAVALVDLDRGEDLPTFTNLFPRPHAWLDAAKALTTGDYVGAANLYAQIGSRPDEADARLRSGVESEVRRALEFYRSVGATRYMREGEALLGPPA